MHSNYTPSGAAPALEHLISQNMQDRVLICLICSALRVRKWRVQTLAHIKNKISINSRIASPYLCREENNFHGSYYFFAFIIISFPEQWNNSNYVWVLSSQTHFEQLLRHNTNCTHSMSNCLVFIINDPLHFPFSSNQKPSFRLFIH